MGNKCGPSPAQQVTVAENPQQQEYVQRLQPFLGLDHPANINNKYKYIQRVLATQQTGNGLKKTYAYKCLVSKEELIKKRSEYWETMVSGNPECWRVLEKCCRVPEAEAYSLLAAGGMKLVNKSLQLAYDESGHKYEVPIYCINDPVCFEPQRQTNVNFIKQQLTIIIRSSKTTTDQTMTVSNTQQVQEIKKLYLMSTKLEDHKVRLFLNGKELQEGQALGAYEISDNQLIQAFLVKL